MRAELSEMREMLTLTLTIVGKNIFFSKMECGGGAWDPVLIPVTPQLSVVSALTMLVSAPT